VIMSNIVEFVVRMKDLMSGGLGKLSSTSQSAFSSMARHADNMKTRNLVLGSSFNELQRKIKDVENTIRSSTIPSQIASARRELASLQRQSNRHSGNLGSSGGSVSSGSSGGFSVGGIAMGSILGNVATQAGSAVVGAVSSAISTGISKSMQKQQDITGLTTFLGKSGAESAYKDIQSDADITPFNTASLLEVNRALISAGTNAKDARADSMNLANAVSAVGGGNDVLSRMAANMQQIKTVGKATAMDIRQFGMAGINIYEMLSKSTGKSIAQVKEMDVTYDDLAKSLAMARGKGGIYEGALEAQGKTMAGKWNTVQDKAGNALSDIADAFSPIINKVLDIGITFANNIQPWLVKAQPYIDVISNGFGTAIDYVMSLGSATSVWSAWIEIAGNWYSVVWDFLKNIFSSVWKIVSGIVEWVSKSEMIKDSVRLILWLYGKIFDVVGWIGDKLVWLWENVLKPILDGLETAYKWVKELVTDGDSLTVEATKKIVDGTKPPAASSTSYFSDLTRFKNNGVASGETEKEKNKKKSKETSETISGGGTKNVTINLGKFFDTIQFTTLNSQESAAETEKIIMELMGRILYNGAKIA
jgi:tape measure domain-containing protein